MAGVLPWSWSTLNEYRTCPKRFYEVRIAKSVKEPDSDYLIWGNHFHKSMEIAIENNIALTGDMQRWEPIRKAMVAAPGTKYVELKGGVTADYKSCGFFDKDCFNRGVDDLVIKNGSKLISVDWKTGKETKGSQQLALSAARLFARFPDVTEINTAYYWAPVNKWSRSLYRKEDTPGIWQSVQPDVDNMKWSLENNAWPARPSGLCKRSKKPGSTYAGCIVTNCPHSENFNRYGDGR